MDGLVLLLYPFPPNGSGVRDIGRDHDTMSSDLSMVRNIGIAAHIDAGKTTTTERILYYARRTHRMGEVDDGTTTTDFDEQEQKRGITIYSAAVTFPWKGYTINLIDTPGHVDFTAEVERSLRVLDGMVAVFDAKEGVEAQSETVWRQADKYQVPRICFINKMDRVGADYEYSVNSLRDRLEVTPLVLQIPIGAGNDFEGLIDLIEMKSVYFKTEALGSTITESAIPDHLKDHAVRARHELIETLSETSETILDQYLNDQPMENSQIRAAIREATIERKLYPVLCGSSLRYIGVQRMLDAVCDFLPSPPEAPPVIAQDANKDDVKLELPCRDDLPLSAIVFKIVAEKPLDLYYIRIYTGKLKPSSRLINTLTGKKENITQIYRMFAKKREQLTVAYAGDIVAVVGPKNALTGHTLCDQHKQVILESITFPETVISVSVEPKSSRDRDKLLESLQALTRQDPTIVITTNAETGQTLISGMGELHLEVIVQRLITDMSVDVIVGKPRVSYRETVQSIDEAEGGFNRQFGGRTHFARIRVRIEPRPHVSGRANFEIFSTVAKGSLKPEYIQASELGIQEASQSGILGGYPVIDWKVTILGGQKHDVDSSELAFENAGRIAFYEAMKRASPVLLQPIMNTEIVTADEYFGAIMADLNSKNSVVRESMLRGKDRIILADVPLSEMFGYVTRLRSLSQGRATVSMTPSHYAPVTAAQMKILVG